MKVWCDIGSQWSGFNGYLDIIQVGFFEDIKTQRSICFTFFGLWLDINWECKKRKNGGNFDLNGVKQK